ncbi:hypothetical protein TIFTF001_021938 [Ficus carica]|uniref:Leucine-rich repeat-containing N-terminal plant-type domain-containing protein n=1 Tax=Ficus carica TaxID=3494 RepID=A0AA88AIE2_FICCA|nr:hypothetical protein TIFTF001_021938 [Ficus carica]
MDHQQESPKIRCLEVERQALLNIKEALHEINEGFLSSWGNEEEKRDCCKWYGIRCANSSDHVTVLDLAPSNSPNYDEDEPWRMFLHGTISPSLRELKHLTIWRMFLHGTISPLLRELKHLTIWRMFLHGTLSPSLRELKHLTYLDLSLINFTGHGIPSFIGTLTK